MTRDETIDLLSVLKAAYPNFYRDMTRKDADHVIDLWFDMFKDEPAGLVALAVKRHIATDTKGFPPHIGAIKDSIIKIQQPEEMTEIEAWNMVRNAIRSYSWDAKEQFDKLPPVLQRLVGSPNQLMEWAQMDPETVSSVVASNFQRSYKARAANEREFLALPTDVKSAMEQIAAGMKMPELPGAPTDQERNAMIRRLEALEDG